VKLLLDTHILLWAAGEPERLSSATRELLEDEKNVLYFSSVNIWEIVIKSGLGRDDFRVNPARLRRLLIANGWIEMSVTSDHVLLIETLPLLHKDPFDRILLAQARAERMQFVTADHRIKQYGHDIISV